MDTCDQLVPLKTQVSLKKTDPVPPKSTSPPTVASYAMPAAARAGGAEPLTWLQVALDGSKVQVSDRAAEPFVPPKRTSPCVVGS